MPRSLAWVLSNAVDTRLCFQLSTSLVRNMLSSLWGLCLLSSARAAVTVHGQIPLAQTSTAFDPEGTGIPVIQLAAYNDTVLNPPPIPDPRPGTAFTLVLPESRDGVYGLSIPQQGAFLGFSIEMSVINQLREPRHFILLCFFVLKLRSKSAKIRAYHSFFVVPHGSDAPAALTCKYRSST